jgi:predicted lipid carrier protein YhbT
MQPTARDMKLPAIPPFLAGLHARLPALPFSAALAGALNLAAWRGLRELDWSAMRGRRFGVHVRDLGLRAYFTVGQDGFAAQVNDIADVTFTATATDFARLALRLEDPDTLFFNRRLVIEGDTDLGLMVKNLLDTVELEAVARAMPLASGGLLLDLRRRLLRN